MQKKNPSPEFEPRTPRFAVAADLLTITQFKYNRTRQSFSFIHFRVVKNKHKNKAFHSSKLPFFYITKYPNHATAAQKMTRSVKVMNFINCVKKTRAYQERKRRFYH